MIYAKLLNEQEIEIAPKELLINARKYVGFTQDFMASQGYRPVMHTFLDHGSNNPESVRYEMYYIDNGSYIKQGWRAIEEEEEG